MVDASCISSYAYRADAYVEREDIVVGIESLFGEANMSSADIVQSRCSVVECDAEVSKFIAEVSEVVPKFFEG